MTEKKSILVVDDERDLRTILSAELEAEGYHVSSAGDGDEAIDMLATARFDLILLDNKMPKVDGFIVLRFVKENYPRTKVIMVTGSTDPRDANSSKELEADLFVRKPYDLSGLLAIVEDVLSGE